jgi:serine/threonine protein kinase
MAKSAPCPAKGTASDALERMDTPEIKLVGDYVVGEKLGAGAFADIFRGRHKDTNAAVALKRIDRTKFNEGFTIKNVTFEFDVLKRLRHPNILQAYESIVCVYTSYATMHASANARFATMLFSLQ